MHEYRRLIEREMDRHEQFKGYGGQARLAEAAGLSPQVVSRVLGDPRERLNQVPEEKTVKGFASALRIEPEAIWQAVAVSLGLPSHVVPSITHEVGTVSNEELLAEVAKRFGLAATFRAPSAATPEGQKINPPTPIKRAPSKRTPGTVKRAARKSTKPKKD